MARFFKGKRKKRKSRVKKGKNLNKCKTVCLNFLEYKSGGYPKLNLWMNEKEKDYLEGMFWDNMALYTNALEMTKEERRNKSDFRLVLERLKQSNKYYRNNKHKVYVG